MRLYVIVHQSMLYCMHTYICIYSYGYIQCRYLTMTTCMRAPCILRTLPINICIVNACKHAGPEQTTVYTLWQIMCNSSNHSLMMMIPILHAISSYQLHVMYCSQLLIFNTNTETVKNCYLLYVQTAKHMTN